MHPIIPDGRGLILLVDESLHTSRGIELVLLERGATIQIPLGIPGDPHMIVQKATNIRFSHCGNELAMLVTVNGGNAPDWIRRFQVSNMPEGSKVKQQGESIVQIVELLRKADREPEDVCVRTYSLLTVPEYGFDLVWRTPKGVSVPELVFLAMLHSTYGAETCL